MSKPAQWNFAGTNPVFDEVAETVRNHARCCCWNVARARSSFFGEPVVLLQHPITKARIACIAIESRTKVVLHSVEEPLYQQGLEALVCNINLELVRIARGQGWVQRRAANG